MELASSGILHPTGLATAAFLVGLVAESATSYLYLRKLAKCYPRQWRHAGERTIWTDSDLISAWATIGYLQRKEYAASGDAGGIAHCDRYRLWVVPTYWLRSIRDTHLSLNSYDGVDELTRVAFC